MTRDLYWDAGDTDVRWGVSLTRSFEGNAAFTTHGLGALGFEDLVIFTPPDALDAPDEYEAVFAVLRAVVHSLRTGEARIEVGAKLTLVGDDPRATRLVVTFVPQEYALHDVLAVVQGRSQTVGLVQLKIEEEGT